MVGKKKHVLFFASIFVYPIDPENAADDERTQPPRRNKLWRSQCAWKHPRSMMRNLVVGASYRCLAVDQEPEHCKVHTDQGCGGIMVDGARPMLDQFIQDSVEESSIEGKLATLEKVAELLVRVRNQTKREL